MYGVDSIVYMKNQENIKERRSRIVKTYNTWLYVVIWQTSRFEGLRLKVVFLLTIIMSSEKQSETNRISKIAGSIAEGLSSLHLSRAPTPIEMDSGSNSLR